MSFSAILGIAILVGALLLAILVLKARNERAYNLAMAEYERKMAEYNAAVAALAAGAPAGGQDDLAAVAAIAAVTAAEDSLALCEGEVRLIGVSEENAAMIIAILCDELGCRPGELCFRSITAL